METLNLKQAAALLNCHPETVRQMACAGELPAAKIGRAWVFIETDLLDWIRTQYGRKDTTPHITTDKIVARINRSISRTKDEELERALGLPISRKRSASTDKIAA